MGRGRRIVLSFMEVDLDKEKQETLEAASEKFVHDLYDHISPPLAQHLDADLDSEVAIGIARRRVARPATLELLGWLVDSAAGEQLTISAAEWAEQCAEVVDYDDFNRRSTLGEDKAREALHVAADAIVAYDRLRTPHELLLGQDHVTVSVR